MARKIYAAACMLLCLAACNNSGKTNNQEKEIDMKTTENVKSAVE